ncbi:hypothetical protein D3C86_1768210 [compost metagenome]
MLCIIPFQDGIFGNPSFSVPELEFIPGIRSVVIHCYFNDEPEPTEKSFGCFRNAWNLAVVFPECIVYPDRSLPFEPPFFHADLVRPGIDPVFRLDRVTLRIFKPVEPRRVDGAVSVQKNDHFTFCFASFCEQLRDLYRALPALEQLGYFTSPDEINGRYRRPHPESV